MCQELEKNLGVVHNQVTINHFLISAGKQNEKQKSLDERTVLPLLGLAISLKHVEKKTLHKCCNCP